MFLEFDHDGKILFINDDLKKFFGYISDDFINRNRIFNLIHADSIVDFIDFYHSFLNSNVLNLKGNFIFLGLDKKKFECHVAFDKIDYKFKLTILKFNKKLDSEKLFMSFFKRFIFLTRIRFVIGSLMPFFFSIPWCIYRYGHLSVFFLFLSFFCLFLLHVSANTLNDYFDWKSGRDKKNTDYILSSTGGSRSIDFKIISEKEMLSLSLFILFIVLIIGCCLIYFKGLFILFIGCLSFFAVYFYSAPPIHLASRRGLGELVHIFCLGPLIIYGTAYVVCGTNDFLDFLIGLPHGLLITGCLLINEYPDSNFDKLSGKNNLAVVLGEKYLPFVYLLLVLNSFIIILILFLFYLPFYFLFIFFLIPYAYFTCKTVFLIKLNDRKNLQLSCLKSLNIYVYYSIILILASVLSLFF